LNFLNIVDWYNSQKSEFMIFTKSWLDEYIGTKELSATEIANTLNRIGLEVDRVEKFSAPDGVVVGVVEKTENHPEADRLQICQIDIGSETLQIVTNDKKVKEGDFVPVATVGTILPSVKIKKGKLRGVDSFGMLCSTEEFGIPRVGEGVVILDSSIGELFAGKPLSEFPIFNDTIIEVELTANRGDCLSIHGISRDLATALKLEIPKSRDLEEKGEFDLDYNISYLEVSNFSLPLKIRTRLAIAGKKENLENYITHQTGVVAKFVEADEKLEFLETLSCGSSQIGIFGKEGSSLELSYIDPEEISKTVFEKGLKTDEKYYNSSRGSEPDVELGVSLLKELGVEFKIGNSFRNISPKREVSIEISEISNLIGYPIPVTEIEGILERLGFEVSKVEENLNLQIPKHRPDIKNIGDVVEEILRIVGIDEIPAVEMRFSEKNRNSEIGNKIETRKRIRNSAISNGFFETLLYVFGEEKLFQRYGFKSVTSEKRLLNPIVESMDTLRPTLTIGLLQALQRNISFGKSRIPLFEIGNVVSKDRKETEMVAFAFSGNLEEDSLSNSGKSKKIDFETFSKMVLKSIGGGELLQSSAETELEHKFVVAKIVRDEISIGKIYKLHPKVQNDFDLGETYIAEIEFSKLAYPIQLAKPYSKFQSVSRDLSVVVPTSLEFIQIRKTVESLEIPILVEFYPVDIFELENGSSLTIRFQLQSMEKTLEESDMNIFTETVLSALKEKLGIDLR
jgi:phenylalanyl-tRNA synthetase beta chain